MLNLSYLWHLFPLLPSHYLLVLHYCLISLFNCYDPSSSSLPWAYQFILYIFPVRSILCIVLIVILSFQLPSAIPIDLQGKVWHLAWDVRSSMFFSVLPHQPSLLPLCMHTSHHKILYLSDTPCCILPPCLQTCFSFCPKCSLPVCWFDSCSSFKTHPDKARFNLLHNHTWHILLLLYLLEFYCRWFTCFGSPLDYESPHQEYIHSLPLLTLYHEIMLLFSAWLLKDKVPIFIFNSFPLVQGICIPFYIL